MNENIKILLDKVAGDEGLLAKFSACKSVDEAYDLAKEGRRALDLGHLAKDYDLYKKGGRVKRFWRD